MAEDYQSSVRATSPQALDLSNVEIAARSMGNLENRLNQVSQILYRDLTQKAIREGREYAVKNPVSTKQVADAVAKKEDVKKLFAAPGTVFGDNARVVQAELFRQDVSQNLNKRVSDVLTAIDRGMYEGDANQFASSIEAEIDGVYNVIAELDPDAALKFKAHGATVSNTVYDKLITKQTEQFLAEKKAVAETQVTAYSNVLSANLVKTRGDFAAAIALSASIKQDLFDAFEALPGGMNDKHLNDIMKLEQEVFANTATSIVQNTPKLRNNFDDVYYQLMTNEPPEELDFYKYLPETTKLEIVDKVQKLNTSNYDVSTKQYTLEKRQAQKDVANLKLQWQELQNTTDINNPNRQDALDSIEQDIERLTLVYPEVITSEGWRKYKDGEFKEVNMFDANALELRTMINNQEFADWSDVVEYALRQYPQTFNSVEEVEATFGKYFLDENEKYVDNVAYDIVTDTMFAYYSTSDRKMLRDRLIRRVKNIISDNRKRNQSLAEGELEFTTDAREIANNLLQQTKGIGKKNEEMSVLQNGMNEILREAKIMSIDPTDSSFVLSDAQDKLLKSKLDDDEYNSFITNYELLMKKREEAINLGEALF